MGNYKEEIAIIIPALDPDERMVSLVRDLRMSGFAHIILVDDGSQISNRTHFKVCKEQYGCKIIRHVVNLGKGIALKSAFNYILENCPHILGAVTVDCDGQHILKDIETCAKLTAQNPDKLTLGCRQFNDKSIPWRSRFGNKTTCIVIRLLCGVNVSDTQTGLRGLPTPLIRDSFANTKGERFEYEMNMLIATKDDMIPIKEFPIETIYLENNESSHFNPFLDSIRIYKVFAKFMLSSFSSFLIDILFFWLLGYLLRSIVPASYLVLSRTIISRLLSSLFNFMVNKNQVFQNDSKSPAIVLKYYTLCIVQLLLSAFLVDHIMTFIPYSTVRKGIIDTLLFVVSFQIQREWVFKKRKTNIS